MRAPVKRRRRKSIVAPLGYLTLASRPPEAKGGCGRGSPRPPSSPLNTNSTRLVGGVLKTGEGVRVGVGEELGVARHGVARPHGRRAAEDGAPGHRLPFLGEDLLYLGVVPLPPKAHSPQTLNTTRARARELLRKKTLPVGHAPTTTPRPRPSTPQPTVTLERARPLPLAALVSLSSLLWSSYFFLCSFQRRGVKFVHMGRIEYRGLVLIISLTESFVIFSIKDVI